MDKNEYSRLWRLANPEKEKASRKRYREKNKEKLQKSQKEYRESTNYHRNWHLVNRYGITLKEYEQLNSNQGGKCAICRKAETSRNKRDGTVRELAVDHNHETGEVRGLLCRACNVSLGFLDEDPVIINRMLEYINKK